MLWTVSNHSLSVFTCQRWVNWTGSVEVLHWDGGHSATQGRDTLERQSNRSVTTPPSRCSLWKTDDRHVSKWNRKSAAAASPDSLRHLVLTATVCVLVCRRLIHTFHVSSEEARHTSAAPGLTSISPTHSRWQWKQQQSQSPLVLRFTLKSEEEEGKKSCCCVSWQNSTLSLQPRRLWHCYYQSWRSSLFSPKIKVLEHQGGFSSWTISLILKPIITYWGRSHQRLTRHPDPKNKGLLFTPVVKEWLLDFWPIRLLDGWALEQTATLLSITLELFMRRFSVFYFTVNEKPALFKSVPSKNNCWKKELTWRNNFKTSFSTSILTDNWLQLTKKKKDFNSFFLHQVLLLL